MTRERKDVVVLDVLSTVLVVNANRIVWIIKSVSTIQINEATLQEDGLYDVQTIELIHSEFELLKAIK